MPDSRPADLGGPDAVDTDGPTVRRGSAEPDQSDRDRNEYGVPENARPRDRTGRPLPYDTDETELTEEHDPVTVEHALALAWGLWDERRYFEAHELLEHVWHHAPEDDTAFWQGVIQVAVLCVHHQRGNVTGVVRTADKVVANLTGYPDVHHGIDTESLRVFAQGAAAAVADAGACIEVGYPDLPVMDSGPVFDPDATATPLTREPPWLAAAKQRAARAAAPTDDEDDHR